MKQRGENAEAITSLDTSAYRSMAGYAETMKSICVLRWAIGALVYIEGNFVIYPLNWAIVLGGRGINRRWLGVFANEGETECDSEFRKAIVVGLAEFRGEEIDNGGRGRMRFKQIYISIYIYIV